MLRSLSIIQFHFLYLQLIVFCFQGMFGIKVIFGFIILMSVIAFQIYFFKKIENKSIYKVDNKKSKTLIVMFIILFILNINGLSAIDQPRTLAALQDIAYIGLITKLGSVLLPATAFTIFLSFSNLKIKVAILFVSFIASGYTAIMILSKMPLIPYVVFTFYLIQVGVIPKYYSLLLIALILPLLFGVYFIRGSAEGILEIPRLILFRITMLSETSHIIGWLQENSPLGFHNIKDYTPLITEKIFGFNSRAIGIAPSFVGFFLAIFGYKAIVLPFLFIYITYFSLKLIDTKKTLSKLFYFLWTLELLSFFTDGIPHFYLSTSGGKLFWGLMFASFIIIMINQLNLSKRYHQKGNI